MWEKFAPKVFLLESLLILRALDARCSARAGTLLMIRDILRTTAAKALAKIQS